MVRDCHSSSRYSLMAGGRWDCTQCWWPKEPTEYLYASSRRWIDERMG
ncbi:hypothetical protein NG798_27045 [Ancylothrix sp. C2]|nr:hypothetical protein [Ancylothrix sp. D3o]MCT7953460.1 hypothetical protein [Ancylothrix sp. D3o]